MAFDDDSWLARKAQRGDRQAFEVILSRYERPILSFIFHFFQNPARCEDLTDKLALDVKTIVETKDSLETKLEFKAINEGYTIGLTFKYNL